MWIAVVLVVVLGLTVGFFFFMKGVPVSTPAAKPRTKEQLDSEHVQRLCYLMKIVFEHSSSERRESSIREVVRIGETVNEAGGFRYMIQIHQTVTEKTSPKVGAKLKTLWKGIGDWRV